MHKDEEFTQSQQKQNYFTTPKRHTNQHRSLSKRSNLISDRVSCTTNKQRHTSAKKIKKSCLFVVLYNGGKSSNTVNPQYQQNYKVKRQNLTKLKNILAQLKLSNDKQFKQFKQNYLIKKQYQQQAEQSRSKLQQVLSIKFSKLTLFRQYSKKIHQLDQDSVRNRFQLQKKIHELSFKIQHIKPQIDIIVQQSADIKNHYNNKLKELENIKNEKILLEKEVNQVYNIYSEKLFGLKYLTKIYTDQKFQIQVLKIQLSPIYKVGILSTKQGLNPKQCLESDMLQWDANKTKKIQFSDICYFIIIQLYKDWIKILRKISYQAMEYKVIFGLQNGPDALNTSYFKHIQKRVSNKKLRRIIAIGSPLYDLYTVLKRQIVDYLSKFNNGFLQITNVNIIETESHQDIFEQLQIIYNVEEHEGLIQIFELHRMKQFTKAQILQFLPQKNEKICCIVINIPLFIPSADVKKYTQIYEVLKRIS